MYENMLLHDIVTSVFLIEAVQSRQSDVYNFILQQFSDHRLRIEDYIIYTYVVNIEY